MRAHLFIWFIVIMPGLLQGSPIWAQTGKVVLIFPQGDTSLSEIEREVLSDSIKSAFSSELQGQYAIQSDTLSSECDLDCIRTQTTGSWIVYSKIAAFGSGHVLKLILIDPQGGEQTQNTNVCNSVDELLVQAKGIATELAGRIGHTPGQGPQAATDADLGPGTPYPPGNGVVRVSATPENADVYISKYRRHPGEPAGSGQVQKELVPGRYFITVTADGYLPSKTELRLDPNETEAFSITLERDYPRNPYKRTGHVLFWSGLTLSMVSVATGAAARYQAKKYNRTGEPWAKEDAEKGAKLMWGTGIPGIALVSAGLLLWIISPGDKGYYERNHSAVFGPSESGRGLSIGYMGRF